MQIKFDMPLANLPAIGEKRAKLFGKLGIDDVSSLLYHFPRAYQHRGNIKLLKDAQNGETCAFMLKVSTEPKISVTSRGLCLIKFCAYDDSSICNITFFNQNYVKDIFCIGSTFRFWGKLNVFNSNFEITSPIFEPYIEGIPLPDLVPLYSLTEGLSQKIVSNTINNTFNQLLFNNPDSIQEIIPQKVRQKYNLCTIQYALRNIHNPTSMESLNIAIARCIFDELFIFALGITISKKNVISKIAPIVKYCDINEFLNLLPYVLTSSQSNVISEIMDDMFNSDHIPMSRLVSGDVGSGKTVCAAVAAYVAIKNKYQVALMVPTEILARQHYDDLFPLFKKLNMETALLIGATKATEKRKIYASLTDGSIQFVIGTHALLEENVVFANLGLVITDEQHRFGVTQRATLAQKTEGVHVLVMSATPIPRTLALILYGDLNVSVISEMPPGRQRVDTHILDESHRGRLYKYMRMHVEDGRQVYIVCPSVEEIKSQEDDGDVVNFDYGYDAEKPGQVPLKAAVDYAADLKANIFPDLNVGFIHGKLKSSEKERIMHEFVNNNIQILVSTTVIEVGVNVPNATIMVVENAERFGLSQLHQLRGRVGRGKHKSFCFLVSDTKNDVSRKRLDIMHTTYDGYKIAEQDLEIRGPGDFLGKRQHGDMKFRLANLCNDMEQLNNAVASAKDIIQNDPDLKLEENKASLCAVKKIFEISYN